MYTEDDEKVKLKKNNSNIEYSDFYTSFNEIEKGEDSKTKNKAKTKSNEVNEEKNHSSFYDVDDTNENSDNGSKKKNIIKISIIAFLILFILIMIILLFKGKTNKVNGDIVLSQESITLNLGEKAHISYKVIDTESSVTPVFESNNSSIATVSSSGEVMAMGVGDAVITIRYTIDGATREKKCNIKVNENKDINQNVELTLNVDGVLGDNWNNKDVVINTLAKSIFGITSVKYAFNCDSDCSYTDVVNNSITVTNNGTTKVKVIAKDNKNQEVSKEVVVKIDKEAPSVTLNSGKNITSSKDVTVCANCSDNLSGCRQEKVCQTYTSTKTNQVITVYDVAGNEKNSESFNVTINRTTKQATSCTLKVSTDGTVTATLDGQATYYGFNESFSGNNELSKKVTINASKAGESRAQIVKYYFQNKNRVKGSCSLIVIKTCVCQGNNSTNCPVTCSFTSQ